MLTSISHSSLTQFEMCPESFRRQKIYDERNLMGIDAHIGIAFHKVVEIDLTRLIEKGKHHDVETLKLYGEIEFMKILELGVYICLADAKNGEQILLNAKNMLFKLIEAYVKFDYLGIKPYRIEEMITMPSKFTLFGSPIDYKGFIDIITLNEKGEYTIRDIKTSGKSWNEARAYYHYQTPLYKKLAESIGIKPKKMIYDVLVKNKKGIEYKPIEIDFTDYDEWDVFERRVQQFLYSIDNGVFPIAQKSSWKCGPKYCFHWLSCMYISDKEKDDYINKHKEVKL